MTAPYTRLGNDGGVRRYKLNGFANKTGTEPPIITTPQTGGGRVSGGYFSRGRWRELKEKWRAEQEVIDRALEAKGRKEREALDRASTETAKARAAIDEGEFEVEFTKLQNALASAAGAATVAKAILQANEATRIAKAIQAEIDDEEEEAIALLLMH